MSDVESNISNNKSFVVRTSETIRNPRTPVKKSTISQYITTTPNHTTTGPTTPAPNNSDGTPKTPTSSGLFGFGSLKHIYSNGILSNITTSLVKQLSPQTNTPKDDIDLSETKEISVGEINTDDRAELTISADHDKTPDNLGSETQRDTDGLEPETESHVEISAATVFEEPPVVKRGRGRPKVNKETIVIDLDQGDESNESGVETEIKEVTAVPKRGRGRPRKAGNVQVPKSKEETPPVFKRGRGRPKKKPSNLPSLRPKITTDEVEIISEHSESGKTSEEPPLQIKRGRGRPKKIVDEKKVNSDESDVEISEPTTVIAEPVRRGRGRPRKIVEQITIDSQEPNSDPDSDSDSDPDSFQSAQETTQPVKRGRGRPRKVIADPIPLSKASFISRILNMTDSEEESDESGDDKKHQTMIIKRGRGRPKLSEEEKLRRLEERKRNQTQSQSPNHIHTLNLKGVKRGRGRPKLSEEEKQERKRQRLETLVKDEQHAKRVRIPRPSTAVTNISVDSEDDNDNDTDIVDTSDSEDDFGKRLKSTHGVKRGRGRPRLSEAEKERRAELRSLGMLHSKASLKLQKKEIRDNKLGDLIEIDQDDYEEDELGDDSDVEVTNFVFISNPKQQHELRDNTSVPKDKRIKIIHKNMHLINAEIFETPKQKRMGLLNLPTAMRTPSKRGIFKLNLPKTPNGRSGISRRLQFDTTIEFEEVENSFSLPQTPVKGTHLQSRSATPQSTLDTVPPSLSRSIFAPNSSRSRHGLPFNVQDFQPMPLPTAQDDERFFEGKYTDQSLFLDGPDGYFDQHKMKNPHSNNSMVQAPQLDYDEFNSLVLLSGFLHHPQKFELLQKYKEMYSQYYFELTENFNLLFYGVGSKRQFIEGFVQGHLLERINDDEAPPVLVINGYNPATTLKEILTKIVQTLKISRAPKSTVELIEFLQKKFFTAKSNNPELILIIHNLDGPSLRDDKTQNYLSKLCSIKQIQLLASIDHLFAPLLWNSSRANNFNFVWHKVSTFMDYLTETSFEDPLILGQTQKSAGSKGAKFVLSSLTENAKALYRVLASNQLQNMEDDLATKRTQSDTTLKGALKHGLLFSQFFSLCAEEFISSNELNFRTMLMEFVEHKMCVLTKDQAGIEKVFIPFTLAEISKLLTDELL